MIYKFHDANSGILDRCQISNRNDLDFVIDLGDQPLCDTLLSKNDLKKIEKKYPLKLYRSKSLGHGQLNYIVPGEEVYFPEYPYRPGITKEVQIHHSERSLETIKKYNIIKNSLIVDIGSNDGTLLGFYKKNSMRVLGVEPTNTAKIAIQDGIDTIQDFFNEKIAKDIVASYGKASLITATNVFAHMSTLGSVIMGIKELLQNNGNFILENHYILNILKDNQYDSIYHEHIRSYSLTSIIYLFKLYDMTVIDAEVVDRYGGTIRVTVANSNDCKISNNVEKYLELEKQSGLFDQTTWNKFRNNVEKTKFDLLNLALNAKSKGQRFVGKSCPGRCSTLINYVGLNKDLLPYIAEQPTSLKLGKFLPGQRIPIVEDQILFDEQPDYVVIFAWHYGKEIAKDLRSRGLKSKFVLPLPNLTILD
tara:strand:- start:383 stop:1642 length:1260 start_codon:yes stop_codon:yes gene_type:complete